MKLLRLALSIAAVVGGAELLRSRARARRAAPGRAEPTAGRPLPDEPNEGGVDETSRESFPASDAPGWTPVIGPGRMRQP